MRLGAARVSLTGQRVARSAQLAASLIAVDRVSLRRPAEALILLGTAKRRAAEMAINLDRLLLQLDDASTRRRRKAKLALHLRARAFHGTAPAPVRCR
jgi:hypothetical protein